MFGLLHSIMCTFFLILLQRFDFLTFFKLDTTKIESLVNRPESLKLDCDDEVLVITIQLRASVTCNVEFDTEGYVTVIVRGYVCEVNA